jgi:hypothetical protein
VTPGPCPTCGHEKRLLFTNYACFNERCGQEAPVSDVFAAWKRLFGEYAQILPGDIEVVRCEPFVTQDAYDVVYRLKGADWYGAQIVFSGPSNLLLAVKGAAEVWDYMRKHKPTAPALALNKIAKSGTWSVP